MEAELLQTLPVAERQKLELAQAEREKQVQEWQNMTPEERTARMAQQGGGGGGGGRGGMNAAGMDKMMRERVLNSTPEQRARMGGPGGGRRGGGGGPGGGGPGRGGPGGPAQ